MMRKRIFISVLIITLLSAGIMPTLAEGEYLKMERKVIVYSDGVELKPAEGVTITQITVVHKDGRKIYESRLNWDPEWTSVRFPDDFEKTLTSQEIFGNTYELTLVTEEKKGSSKQTYVLEFCNPVSFEEIQEELWIRYFYPEPKEDKIRIAYDYLKSYEDVKFTDLFHLPIFNVIHIGLFKKARGDEDMMPIYAPHLTVQIGGVELAFDPDAALGQYELPKDTDGMDGYRVTIIP